MKVILKALSLVLALMMVFALVACGVTVTNDTGSDTPAADSGNDAPAADASDSNPLVGSWEYQSGGFTYTFNADGSGTYDIGADSPMVFTYEYTDTELSILYEGNTDPMVLEYEINGDVLNVKDSFGSDTLYNRK